MNDFSFLEGLVTREKLNEYSKYLKAELEDLQGTLLEKLSKKNTTVNEPAGVDTELEDELDEDIEDESEPIDFYDVGSFVLVEIAPEIFVNASIDAVYSDNGYYRYDLTTEHGLRIVGVYEHRLHTKPPFSEEEYA